MSAEVLNFGCRLNLAEGEAIRAATEGLPDLIVVNSCAVTAEAERQARQAIRRAKRARPDARIVLTGCAAQVAPERWAAMPELHAVIGNREKRTPLAYRANARVAVGDIFDTAALATPIVSGRDHARAFIEVQTGCDHRCTFCIIPFGRGNSASAPPATIIAAIRAAVARGQREAVLTGVDLTSYAGGLAPLVAQILRDVPDLPRLRLSSLDPFEVDDALFALITNEPRIMPHVHLSLQSGDDLILKRMKRRHSRAQAVDLVQRLKATRPDIAIGADIIAGFPTEDETMFANSLSLIDDCDIVFAHVFPYSPRPGTPAARMPQVPVVVARDRAAQLRAAAAARKAAWLDTLIGTTQQVLVERDGVSGHVANFAKVRCSPQSPHAIVAMTIVGRDGETLTGVPA